jgi:hypothetical protein
MFGDYLAQLFDFLGDHGFKIKDVPFSEKWGEGIATFLVDFMALSQADTTRNPQRAQLVVIFVPVGHWRGIYNVQEADVIDMKFIWSDPDDRT